MKKIITIPHLTLRKQSKSVVKIDKKLIKFVDSLEETLGKKRSPKGVGLAAPQINKLWRIFSINLDQIETFINPEIINTSNEITFGPDKEDPILEGCLSMPEIYGPVPRFLWVEVDYQSIDGDSLIKKRAKLENFKARVFQHELDHLDGILFTDHSLKHGLPVYKELKKNKYEEITNRELLKIY